MEYAWLAKNKDCWSFYPENTKEEKRQFGNRESAITELAKEGWSISTLYYEEGAEPQCCAYGMVRFVH